MIEIIVKMFFFFFIGTIDFPRKMLQVLIIMVLRCKNSLHYQLLQSNLHTHTNEYNIQLPIEI